MCGLVSSLNHRAGPSGSSHIAEVLVCYSKSIFKSNHAVRVLSLTPKMPCSVSSDWMGGGTAVNTHSFIVLSSEALMKVPLWADDTDVTPLVWPVYVRMQTAENASQTLIVVSLEPVKKVTGSTAATAVTGPL